MITLHRQEQELIQECLDACDNCITACEELESCNTMGTPSHQELALTRACFKEAREALEIAKNCVALFSARVDNEKNEPERIECDGYRNIYYALVKACNLLIAAIQNEGDYQSAADECIKACDAAAELSERLLEEE